MNMLKAGIPTSTYFTRAQYIRKNRPTEQWKRICRIMIAAINAVNIIPDGKAPQKILEESMQSIRNVIKEKAIELNTDSAELRKCMTELQHQLVVKRAEEPLIGIQPQDPIYRAAILLAHEM